MQKTKILPPKINERYYKKNLSCFPYSCTAIKPGVGGVGYFQILVIVDRRIYLY